MSPLSSSPLRVLVVSCCVAAVGALPAQGVSPAAVAATDLVVTASAGFGAQTQSIPLGTPLFDGSSVTANVFGLVQATIRVVMPAAPSATLYRLECSATSPGSPTSSFVGDTLLTLTAAQPTAADLMLTCAPSGLGLTSGSIDVGNDGSREVSTQSGILQRNVQVLLGPAPLPVRTSMSGIGLESFSAALVLQIGVREILSAGVTSYLAGCGPTITVTPTTTSSMRVAVASLPPAGIAFVVVGLARANRTLPFGGCLLGVRTDWPLRVGLDASGSGVLDITVPHAVRTFTADVQAVGLDFVTGSGVVATSDAIEVQLNR